MTKKAPVAMVSGGGNYLVQMNGHFFYMTPFGTYLPSVYEKRNPGKMLIHLEWGTAIRKWEKPIVKIEGDLLKKAYYALFLAKKFAKMNENERALFLVKVAIIVDQEKQVLAEAQKALKKSVIASTSISKKPVVIRIA